MQKVHYIAKSHLVFRSRKKLESAAEMALRPAVTDCVDREKKPNRDENNALKRRLPSPRLFLPLAPIILQHTATTAV